MLTQDYSSKKRLKMQVWKEYGVYVAKRVDVMSSFGRTRVLGSKILEFSRIEAAAGLWGNLFELCCVGS